MPAAYLQCPTCPQAAAHVPLPARAEAGAAALALVHLFARTAWPNAALNPGTVTATRTRMANDMLPDAWPRTQRRRKFRKRAKTKTPWLHRFAICAYPENIKQPESNGGGVLHCKRNTVSA